MANTYIKNNWYSNELITAAKLNRMEDGIEDAYNRAERNIMAIIDTDPELTQMLKERITDLMLEIDEENNKLIFKL